jgi:hypothetical protein
LREPGTEEGRHGRRRSAESEVESPRPIVKRGEMAETQGFEPWIQVLARMLP